MTHSLRRRTRGVAIGAIVMLSASMLWTGSAIADPENPTTADQAQQAYLDSSHRAGALNEELLVAQDKESAATAAATAAGEQVTASTAAVESAKTQAAQADAAAASYQAKVDAFANASFRGARLDGMSVLLTAGSAEDFLDQMSSLDRVAADSQQTLDEAVAARDTAAQAKAQADAAAAAAAQAKADADAAAASAQQATADVTSRKSDLDAEAARYKASGRLAVPAGARRRGSGPGAGQHHGQSAAAPAEAASRSETRADLTRPRGRHQLGRGSAQRAGRQRRPPPPRSPPPCPRSARPTSTAPPVPMRSTAPA